MSLEDDLLNLLSSFMGTESDRRAQIILAFGTDNPVERQLNFSGATDVFVLNLIHSLKRYGEYPSGTSALWTLMLSIRNQVGADKQKRIDELQTVIIREQIEAPLAPPSPNPRLRDHIFISYAHADRAFVEKLVGNLRERGYLVWIDLDGIRGGDVWRQAISDGVSASGVVLVILSPDSVKSEWVKIELTIARKQGKKIVPLLAHPLVTTEDRLAYERMNLEAIQYLDFTQDYRQGLKRLLFPGVLPAPETSFRDRRLEAAMPKQTRQQARTEVWVKVVLPDSLGLKNELPAMVESGDIIEKSDVRANQFTIQFRRDKEGDLQPIKVCLEVKSPDFEVSFDREKSRVCNEHQAEIELHPGADSRTFVFYLTPHPNLIGRARVNVSLYVQGMRKVTEISVSTELVAVVEKISWAVFTAAVHAEAEQSAETIRSYQGLIVVPSTPGISRLSLYDLRFLDWCDIPEGYVTIEGQRILVPAFRMAKYPITYAQFQPFLDAPDGYRNGEWWTGLAWRGETPKEQQWKINTHPRENVNWYEAMAYSRWLNTEIGWLITLPTESQWQRAAQGDDGRVFPWGNDFDPSRCNTGESRIGQTTPVDKYPLGASPFGVMDMAGNVWEWCLSRGAFPYQYPEDITPEGNSPRGLRGGSWDFDVYGARAAFRSSHGPSGRYHDLGFRVVVAPVSL
ncbi:MAG: SUMF1/EgtB/PvdO family nonheme iron enzyme [Anaerolineae bacterium]|nr:SUMF1/EgtB/PvdO family nonheme iron enzyme [Anaerolineae bacterium]